MTYKEGSTKQSVCSKPETKYITEFRFYKRNSKRPLTEELKQKTFPLEIKCLNGIQEERIRESMANLIPF